MSVAALALLCSSCEGDEGGPKVPNQTLNVGQSFTIPIDGVWTSDNDFIASVDGKSVKGIRVGEVTIRNGEQSFEVTVNPTITLFKDPYLNFGSNMQMVKDAMNSFDFLGEEDGSLVYMDKTNSVLYGYTFETSKLKMSMVMAPSSIGSATRVGEFLAERYVPVTNQKDYIGMISPDKTMLIIVMVKVQGGKTLYTIAYSPYTGDASRSNDIEHIFEEIITKTPGKLVKGGMN